MNNSLKRMVSALSVAALITGSMYAQENVDPNQSADRKLRIEKRIVRMIDKDGKETTKIDISGDDLALIEKDALMARNEVKRPFLGVSLGKLYTENDNQGVVVSEVTKDSPAEKAGIQNGDIILTIDGKHAISGGNVAEIIQSKKAGENVTVNVLRNGENKTLNATLGEKSTRVHVISRFSTNGNNLPELKNLKDLKDINGLNNLVPDIRLMVEKEIQRANGSLLNGCDKTMIWVDESSTGNPCERLREMNGTAMLGVYISTSYRNNVFVENTIKSMGAETSGIQRGDVITAIDGTPVKNYNELRKAVTSHKPGERVAVTYKRNGEESIMHVTLSSLAETRKELVSNLEKQCTENGALPKAGTEQSTVQMGIEQIAVHPNPTTGLATVRFNSTTSDNIAVAVTDMEGREVLNMDQKAFVGTVEVPVDLTEVPKGIYFVNISQNGQTYSQRIIVQ